MRRVLLVILTLVATGVLTVPLWGRGYFAVPAGGGNMAVAAPRFQPQASSGSAAGRFIGTWRLVSVQTNGKPNPNRGVRPTGLIIYDAAGNMAVQDRARTRQAIVAPDRRSYTGSGQGGGDRLHRILWQVHD